MKRSSHCRAKEIKSSLPQPTQPGMQAAAGPIPAKDSAASRAPQPMSKMDTPKKANDPSHPLKMMQAPNKEAKLEAYDSCTSGGNKAFFSQHNVISFSPQL